ncbi:MAG: FHA domain-containing protein [Chloroflexota bacterium]
MSDQPKPTQPAQPSPPVQPTPKDISTAADKAPTSPASSNEPKAPSVPSEPKVDAAPESKPDAVPVSANSAPTKPTTSDSSGQPPKPATPESDASTIPSKPAATESSTAQPAKPANGVNGQSQSAPVSSSAPTEKRDISEDPTLPGKPASNLGGGVTRTVEPPKGFGEKDDTIPPQSGANKVTQRFTEQSPVGQIAAGVICPSCGHRNRPGTLICDNCGTNLVGGVKAAVGTRDLVAATEAAAATNEPLMDAAQLNALESAGGSVFSDDMVLRIEIEGGATPMLVYPKQEIILGRRDPNTGTLPDVDMTAYSGYRMGVSRTHASIHLQDKQLNLSDRGSSNGTFLNGTRLVAHRPYPVKDGDEIRLGQMVLKVYFQSNKNRK